MAKVATPPVESGGSGRGLGVFRNRDFRLLWTGAVASNIGTWINQIALGWLVVTLTNSPGWLGAVALANSIPFLILPLFGGVVADRVDRVKLLKVTQATSMCLSLTLGTLTLAGMINIWEILLVAFLNSTSNSFDQPTRQALLPELVKPDELMQALSLQSTAYQGAALVGPAISGVLVGVIGTGGCFMIDAASYLFVLLALFMMRVPPAPPRQMRSVSHDMAEGLSFVRGSPVILSVLLATCFFSIFGRSYSTLMPAFAKIALHTSSRTLGLMYAMPGLGTLIGGFALAAYGDIRQRGTFMTVMALVTAGAVFGFATSSSLLVILPLLVLAGVAITAFNATGTTILQLRTPAEMRGRVMSYNTIAWRGLTSLGGSLVGVMAEAFGIRPAIAGGAVVVAVAILMMYVLTPFIRAADRPAVVEVSSA